MPSAHTLSGKPLSGAASRPARSAFALIAGAATLLLSMDPAAARPTIGETMSFARSEINRFCDDENLSWFDEIDERPVSRSCRATLTRNKLSMQVSYQHEIESSDRAEAPIRAEAIADVDTVDAMLFRATAERYHAGRKQIDLEFDSSSNFLCGPRRANGYAPLYFNCLGESAISDESCVIERQERWGVGGRRSVVQKARSFALLFNLRTEECQMLRNALNFIVSRTPTPPETEIREFFRE